MPDNTITLHRDQSGDKVRMNPSEIQIKAENARGTFIELRNGFKCTVRESIEEIDQMIQQSEAS